VNAKVIVQVEPAHTGRGFALTAVASGERNGFEIEKKFRNEATNATINHRRSRMENAESALNMAPALQ
jgi:hypothetical protein